MVGKIAPLAGTVDPVVVEGFCLSEAQQYCQKGKKRNEPMGMAQAGRKTFHESIKIETNRYKYAARNFTGLWFWKSGLFK
jgi:hypothetical protein